jgi:hypothetical protein
MGFFGSGDDRVVKLEKELRAGRQEAEQLKLDLATGRAQGAESAKLHAEEVAQLRQEIDRLLNAPDKPLEHHQLTGIVMFLRCVGLVMVLSSLMLAFKIASIPHMEVAVVEWGLYLLGQFAGLYLLFYGTRFTVRSRALRGAYMAAICAVTTFYAGMSAMGYAAIAINSNLIGLCILNAVGFYILIDVERTAHSSRAR